jgi:hypothetical protein
MDSWYENYNLLDWFFLFFPLSVIRKIAASTNTRGQALALQKLNKRGKPNQFKWAKELDLNEMVRWFSLFFLMSFMQLPRRRMYWNTKECGAYVGPAFGSKSGISLHRWEYILRVLSYGPGPFVKKGHPNYIWDRISDLVM